MMPMTPRTVVLTLLLLAMVVHAHAYSTPVLISKSGTNSVPQAQVPKTQTAKGPSPLFRSSSQLQAMRTFADGTEEKNALDSVKSFVTKRLPPKALQFVKGLTWSKTSMTALVVGFVLCELVVSILASILVVPTVAAVAVV